LYRKEDTLALKIYTKADYASSVIDMKSTSRYCIFHGESIVIWRIKKQDRESCSSSKAKF